MKLSKFVKGAALCALLGCNPVGGTDSDGLYLGGRRDRDSGVPDIGRGTSTRSIPDPMDDPTVGDRHVDFPALRARFIAARPEFTRRQAALLEARYDLRDRRSARCRNSRGNPVQGGVRVRLPPGVTWQSLAAMSPAEIRARDLFPQGFLPLPHPNHAEGGMLFPQNQIDEIRRQTGRDLARFDLGFDLPLHLLPEFPPAIYLTTRPDLGDVSRGQLVTTDNYFEMFKDLLNPKQLDGLRLLVTPFAQQQFNLIDDRRVERPSLGVSCFDCHANGHSNAGTHLVGDIRPQAFRNRIDTPTLRGVNLQRLFGSQRALRSIEDFTEFEQSAAYFDGDPVAAALKGVNILDRLRQVQHMAEFQEVLDFPPAPHLDRVTRRLDHAVATPSERRGQELFFGRGRCATCHEPPLYSDNLMNDLAVDRFFTPRLINGAMAAVDGPIKTFPLRGLRDSPPYFHDGRLLTIEDTVEFFNLVLQLRLSEQEKSDLADYLCAL